MMLKNMEYEIPPNMILFFDMDGTLVDTNYANFLSYKKAIKTVMDLDCKLLFNPTTRINKYSLKEIIPKLTDSEYESIIKEKRYNYNYYLHETKLLKEIADILFIYSKTNKTFLVTNSCKERALMTLSYLGVLNQFNGVFCREYGSGRSENKFQNAIDKLGVSPDFIIVFEDEEVEIFNAIQAGIKNINPRVLK